MLLFFFQIVLSNQTNTKISSKYKQYKEDFDCTINSNIDNAQNININTRNYCFINCSFTYFTAITDSDNGNVLYISNSLIYFTNCIFEKNSFDVKSSRGCMIYLQNTHYNVT